MKVKAYKFKKLANLVRAHYNDSGADCFSMIDVVINPHTVVKVPTGIAVDLPDGFDICVNCKSGLSSKGLWAANAPVDAGYKPDTTKIDADGYLLPDAGAEIHAIICNVTDNPIEIKAGEKIGQFVMRPIIYADFVFGSLGEERKGGAFGSTGNR